MIRLIILGLMLILVGCSGHQADNKLPHRINMEQDTLNIFQKNRLRWNREIKKVRIVDRKFFDISPNYHGTSFQELKNNNLYVVKATVMNLKKVKWSSPMPQTKITFKVKKVISGNKGLEKKRLYLNFPGGFARERDIYTTNQGTLTTAEPDNEIFYRTPNTPLPEIGSTVIMCLRNDSSQPNSLDKLYINDVEHTFWIKNKDKYVLNNPAFQTADRKLKIFKLTEELNQIKN
ncbi:hypothetical protein [Companilactobacillus sp. HBUAS56257]|uniref:hypothetical protein n=1 Tax=Companilactobacillus sp. HBUAS56257 TaxID=3109360 RepID=UPI002FEF153A